MLTLCVSCVSRVCRRGCGGLWQPQARCFAALAGGAASAQRAQAPTLFAATLPPLLRGCVGGAAQSSSGAAALRTEALLQLRRASRSRVAQRAFAAQPALAAQLCEALLALLSGPAAAASLDLRAKYLGERVLKRLLDQAAVAQALATLGAKFDGVVRGAREYHQRLCDLQRQSLATLGDDSDAELDEDEADDA